MSTIILIFIMINPSRYKKSKEGIYDFILNRLDDCDEKYYRAYKIINYYNNRNYNIYENMGAYNLMIEFNLLKFKLKKLAIERDGKTYKKLWNDIIVDKVWDK